MHSFCFCFFFFFQAEDGIRDLYVTGVQTCALPIFLVEHLAIVRAGEVPLVERAVEVGDELLDRGAVREERAEDPDEIGRASCRERVEIWVGAGSCKKKKIQEVCERMRCSVSCRERG